MSVRTLVRAARHFACSFRVWPKEPAGRLAKSLPSLLWFLDLSNLSKLPLNCCIPRNPVFEPALVLIPYFPCRTSFGKGNYCLSGTSIYMATTRISPPPSGHSAPLPPCFLFQLLASALSLFCSPRFRGLKSPELVSIATCLSSLELDTFLGLSPHQLGLSTARIRTHPPTLGPQRFRSSFGARRRLL